MSSWKEDAWALIREHRTTGEKFTLSWLYGYAKVLGKAHPENKAVNAKLRQVCQELAAEGKVLRLSPGLYQVLPVTRREHSSSKVSLLAEAHVR